MSKKITSRVLTALLLVVLLGVFAYKQRSATPRQDDTPEAAIWRMIDASRASDTENYLGCYTGEMENSLRRNAQDMGAAKFRDYLAGAMRPLKGIAVSPLDTSSPAERRVAVEYVYEDRNEVQQVYLRQVDKRWKIYRVAGAERVKTLVPYGTPVTD